MGCTLMIAGKLTYEGYRTRVWLDNGPVLWPRAEHTEAWIYYIDAIMADIWDCNINPIRHGQIARRAYRSMGLHQ